MFYCPCLWHLLFVFAQMFSLKVKLKKKEILLPAQCDGYFLMIFSFFICSFLKNIPFIFNIIIISYIPLPLPHSQPYHIPVCRCACRWWYSICGWRYEIGSILPYVGFGNKTRATSLCNQHLYILSHLTSHTKVWLCLAK